MKPRLEPCDHTDDDALIWNRVVLARPSRFGSTLWTRSLMQDRQDGELMLHSLVNRLIPVGTDPDTGLNLWWQR